MIIAGQLLFFGFVIVCMMSASGYRLTIKVMNLLAISLFFSLLAHAQGDKAARVKMPSLFGSNMILQQGKPVKLWGTASPGAAFSVDFGGSRKKVIVNGSGEWSVTFHAQKAGVVTEIKVNSDSSFIYKNVMMGDLWLCSGQSNMEFTYGKTDSIAQDLIENDHIRSLNVPYSISNYPQDNFKKTAWLICNKENVLSYSAVAYYFAKKIYQKTGIPVGIINASWGGTSIKAWISESGIKTIPQYSALLNDLISRRYTSRAIDSITTRNTSNAKLNDQVLLKKDSGFIDGFAEGKKGRSAWNNIELPGVLHQNQNSAFRGVIWLSKEINLPELKKEPLTIFFGRIVGAEDFWLNGVKIGSNNWWKNDNLFYLPNGLLKQGRNFIVIRVVDREGKGIFSAKPEEMQIRNAATKANIVSIAGSWEMSTTLSTDQLDQLLVKLETVPPNTTPTSIYNTKINPFIPLPITGFLWYQGENDDAVAVFYKTLFQTLIRDWRKQFGQGDLPFIFAQLPRYGTPPSYNGWTEIRESQSAALVLPRTAMAVTLDAGNPVNIHPHYKKPVGERMANAALDMVYKKTGIPLCPLYRSFSVKDDGIHVFFKNAGSGLKALSGTELDGFMIAGPDEQFIKAEARIAGRDEIIVFSQKVSGPVAVRYAWLPDPADANLYNQEGMPASPFRTDQWKLKTDGKFDN